MPILQRFLLAFGLIIGIGAVQSATTVFSLGTLSSELEGATTVPIAQVDAAWRASDAFLRADAFLAGALDGIRDQPNTETIARFKAFAAPIEAELGRALANSSGPKPLVDAIGQWKASALVLLGEAPAVSIPAPHVMEKRGVAIRAALQGLISDALAKSAAARATIQAQALRTEALTVIFAVAAIVIGIGIAVPSALTLTRPLQRLQTRMRSMTEGDLDSAITEGGRADEIGHIAKALHFMRDRLAERRRMEGEAAAAHRDAEQRLHATEAAFAAAGREQAEIVRQLGLALDRIARGDLTTRITEDVPREYAKLKADFNNSIGSIEATVASVASTTDELRDGSEDMAQAAVDSSRRSEQQAARLQHAASSLNAISDAIRGTAASTRQASKVISAANADADRSSAMMQDAIGAISRIEESSGQITRIIGVIDEIAFQTTILALNAAIEAARAGEGGRGFSIVAAEVRALAQRSAAAAKEIKGLITQTSISVKDGADLIGRTGQVIGVIMGKVADIDKLVGSVATAAEQQAAGLHGVVNAVSEADQATQQDLKVSGHAADSVQALRDQAMSLADLVRRFTVEDTQAIAPPHHLAA